MFFTIRHHPTFPVPEECASTTCVCRTLVGTLSLQRASVAADVVYAAAASIAFHSRPACSPVLDKPDEVHKENIDDITLALRRFLRQSPPALPGSQRSVTLERDRAGNAERHSILESSSCMS